MPLRMLTEDQKTAARDARMSERRERDQEGKGKRGMVPKTETSMRLDQIEKRRIQRQKFARRRKPLTKQGARDMRRPVQPTARFETGKPMRPRVTVKTKEGDFEFKKGGMKKMLTGGQLKIAAKAPPTNKIDEKDFAVLREEKAKQRGKGLQDEKMKPGKVMKARRGDFIKRRMMLAGKSDGDTSFDAKMRAQDAGVIDKKTGKGRKKFMEKAKSVKLGKRLLIPIAIGIAAVQGMKAKMKKKKEEPKKKMGGGMMKKRIGGMSTKDDNKRDIRKVESMIGASRSSKREQAIKKSDTASAKKAIGMKKSITSKGSTRIKKDFVGYMGGGMMQKYNKGGGADMGSPRMKAKAVIEKARDAIQRKKRIRAMQGLTSKDPMPKKMGGGMMQRPMGMMKKGQMVKARGGGMARIKPTKMF